MGLPHVIGSARSNTLGIVNRDSQTGVITLGAKFEDLKREEKKDEWTLRRQKVYGHIVRNPEKTTDELALALSMSKKTLIDLLEDLDKNTLIYSRGEGKRGDPKKWFANVATVGKAVPVSQSEVIPEYNVCVDGDCTNFVSKKGEFCERHVPRV